VKLKESACPDIHWADEITSCVRAFLHDEGDRRRRALQHSLHNRSKRQHRSEGTPRDATPTAHARSFPVVAFFCPATWHCAPCRPHQLRSSRNLAALDPPLKHRHSGPVAPASSQIPIPMSERSRHPSALKFSEHSGGNGGTRPQSPGKRGTWQGMRGSL